MRDGVKSDTFNICKVFSNWFRRAVQNGRKFRYFCSENERLAVDSRITVAFNCNLITDGRRVRRHRCSVTGFVTGQLLDGWIRNHCRLHTSIIAISRVANLSV